MPARARYCQVQHKKNAASARHRERNPGYYARYSRSEARLAYNAEHADERRAYAREYARTHRVEPEHRARQAAWWARNQRKRYEYAWLRQAKKWGTAGEAMLLDIRDWIRLVRRYDGRCAYCAKRLRTVHMDHVIPISRGGLHRIGNVLPACHSCNSSKHGKLLIEWKAS